MAYVDYMDEYVGVTHLVEGRLEGVDKMGGKLADESYGVGEQEGEIVDDDLAHGGVESGKKLVLGKYIALAEQVHQCRLAHVGIAYQCYAGKFSAILALYRLLLVDAFKLGFQA